MILCTEQCFELGWYKDHCKPAPDDDNDKIIKERSLRRLGGIFKHIC